MSYFKKCVYLEDLIADNLLSLLGTIFVLYSPYNETFLRIPFALSLFFFTPGYAFIAILFPGKKEISGIERFTLSVGFSIVLTVFAGFLISVSPWSYRPVSISTAVIGMTSFFSIIAIFTRKLLDESEQFSFSVKELLRSNESNEIGKNSENQEKIITNNENRHFHRSRSKVKALRLMSQPDVKEKKPFKPPGIEKALVFALIVSVLIAGGMFAYAKANFDEETFTVLYLLGSDGKAENYPTESLINVPLNITVGIENHETEDVNYVLQMRADDEAIEELNFSLKDGSKWQKNMTYARQKLKTGKTKLEFELFKGKVDQIPYRSVHLLLDNNNTLSNLDKQKQIEIPVIENGDMESLTGWKFTSNTDKITGSYINESGIDYSNAYEIINSHEGNLSSISEFGKISQNIECKENTTLMLSAYVKSVSNSSSQGAENQQKQIIVNGETIWVENMSENENWQHVLVPITLQAGNNNLALGLNQSPGEIKPLQVFWDSISLNLLSDYSNIPETGIVEATAPTSRVLELPNYTRKNIFDVSWNGTDEDSGIAYYSIDYSTDGINWKNWIRKTTENSSVFTGKNNVSYYFRSKAVDKAGNAEYTHKDPDTQTKIFSGTPEIKLDISPNPCKNATTFTVTYSLPLKSAVCIVTSDAFGSESVELKSTDGFNWIGTYKIKHGKRFNVEAVCTDTYGNTISAFDELSVDNSLSDFVIEISPKTIDMGNLEIKITPSNALIGEPSVSISANKTVNITYMSYSDGTYYYKAEIEPDVNEGEHDVSVTGTGLDYVENKGSSTFVISHPKK